MGRRRYPKIVVAALAGIVLSSAAYGSQAEPYAESRGVIASVTISASSERLSGSTPSDAQLEDMDQARSQGLWREAQIETTPFQELFAHAVTRIQEAHPGSYTASWVESSDDTFWVAVPGDLSEGVRGELDGLPFDVNVVEDVGRSEEDFIGDVQDLHHAIMRWDGVADAETGGDPLTGVITSTVKLGPELGVLPEPELDVLVETMRLRLSGEVGASTARIEIVLDQRLLSAHDTLYGGSQLRTCTAGFSVRSSAYSNGMLTADHCSNAQSPSGGDSLAYRDSAAYSKGDVQWHSSSGATLANFYISSSTRRPVYATANPVDGAIYCRYGRTTGNYCDQVYLLNRCRGSYCGLVAMFERFASGGDSGGPWYSGYTAFGVHSGGLYYLGLLRDCWSPIRPAAADLGVTVKTTSTS